MTDASKTDKKTLLQNFTTGRVPTEEDFAALITLADHPAAALGVNTTEDISKPVGDGAALGGLQVKGGKLTVVTDPASPLTVKPGPLTLGVNPAHLDIGGDKLLGVKLNPQGGVVIAPDDKGQGLTVAHGQGITLGDDGMLAVNIGSGLAADAKDANKLTLNVGKGLAVDTQTPQGLIVNVSDKGGLGFDKATPTLLSIALTKDANLVQDANGLSLSEDALKKLAAASSGRFREAINKVNPPLPLKNVAPEDYLQIRKCFGAFFAYVKEKKFTLSDVLANTTLVAPEFASTDNVFRLTKPDGSVLDGESTGGAFVFDTTGFHGTKFDNLPEKFSIAVGSVGGDGAYSASFNKFTHNALLLYKGKSNDKTAVRVLGWWDLNDVLKNTDSAPALNTGWHAWSPVLLEPAQSWETVIAGLYSHQNEIDALKARLEYMLALIPKKRSSLSLSLESKGTDIFVSTSAGEHAMDTTKMWIMKSDTQVVSGGVLKSLDDSGTWAPGCYLFLGETTDQVTLHDSGDYYTRNALVICVGDKTLTSGQADVRVMGSFHLTEDGKHAEWQPVVPGIMAQSADRFREAMNRVHPAMGIQNIGADDYPHIEQSFGQLLAYAKTNGWHEGDILADTMLRTQPYNNDAYFTFQIKKPDGTIVDGEGDAGNYVFTASGCESMKYASLPAGFSIAVGSVTDQGEYSKNNHKWTQNALLLFKEDKTKNSSVRVMGWWDMGVLLKKFYADGRAPLLTGWQAWTPLLLDPAQPWETVVTGLTSHEDEIAALKSRLEAVLGAAPDKHHPPVVSLGLDKHGESTIITSSYGESAMGSNLAWLFMSTLEELHSPYTPFETRSPGCYLFVAHTDDNGSFSGTKTRYTKNALVIYIGPKAATGKPDVIRVIGNFIISQDGKTATWQPGVESAEQGQDIPSARKALEEKLKPLMVSGQQPTNEFARINISASAEHTIENFYWGNNKKYPADSLKVYRAGLDTPVSIPTDGAKKLADGWYAVTGTLDDSGQKPLAGGKKATANAVMVGKFGEVVTVAGYWDLVDGSHIPVWYPTEPDPALYDTVRNTTGVTFSLDGKPVAHPDGERVILLEKTPTHKLTVNGLDSRPIIWTGVDNENLTFDSTKGDLTLKKWSDTKIDITATQMATRRKNKAVNSVSIIVAPDGENEITPKKTLEGTYYKDHISDLKEWIGSVDAKYGPDYIGWKSSDEKLLIINGKEPVSTAAGFATQNITLTATSIPTNSMRASSKKFTFSFCETKIKYNPLSLGINEAITSNDEFEVTIKVNGGDGFVPSLKSKTQPDYKFGNFKGDGDDYIYKESGLDLDSESTKNVYFGTLIVEQPAWNGYESKSIEFKLNVKEKKAEDYKRSTLELVSAECKVNGQEMATVKILVKGGNRRKIEVYSEGTQYEYNTVNYPNDNFVLTRTFHLGGGGESITAGHTLIQDAGGDMGEGRIPFTIDDKT